MAIHAQAVEILVTEGHFRPEVALGIAEAIEVSVRSEQFVTVPILDARLQELKGELKGDIAALRTELKGDAAALRTELHVVKAELVRWVFLTMLGNIALSLGASEILKLMHVTG